VSEISWSNLARAVTCNLEWERLCERGDFLDENSLHRAVAEYLQSVSTSQIKTEYNHKDIPGNTLVDLVGFGPQGKKIDFAVEAKWIKEGGGTRDWPAEVADDVFRLELLDTDMAQQCDRVVVVSGISGRIDTGLINKGMNAKVKGQNRPRWLDELLPESVASQPRKTNVRDCKVAMKPFFAKRAKAIGVAELPISYQAQLVGHYRVDPKDKDVVETYVWRISRSQNRTVYTP
jgi:hypothetical protein